MKVIIIDKVTKAEKTLDDTVKNVNRTVSPDERLADHAYYFNGEKLEA